MAEFQFALNQVDFWLDATIQSKTVYMALADDTDAFMCSWKIGERAVDRARLNSAAGMYPCINRSAFDEEVVCRILLENTMAASWGYGSDLNYENAFSATGSSQGGNKPKTSNGFSRVKWGHEMLPTLLKATMMGPSCKHCTHFLGEQKYYGDIDTSDANIKFLFRTGYTLDQVNYHGPGLSHYSGQFDGTIENIPHISNDDLVHAMDEYCTKNLCLGGTNNANRKLCYDKCTAGDIMQVWDQYVASRGSPSSTVNVSRKIDPGIHGINWVALQSQSATATEKNVHDLKEWVAEGSPCYDNFCGPQISTMDYDGCSSWTRGPITYSDDDDYNGDRSTYVHFPCQSALLGRVPTNSDGSISVLIGTDDEDPPYDDTRESQATVDSDTPLLYVGFVAAAHDYR